MFIKKVFTLPFDRLPPSFENFRLRQDFAETRWRDKQGNKAEAAAAKAMAARGTTFTRPLFMAGSSTNQH